MTKDQELREAEEAVAKELGFCLYFVKDGDSVVWYRIHAGQRLDADTKP